MYKERFYENESTDCRRSSLLSIPGKIFRRILKERVIKGVRVENRRGRSRGWVRKGRVRLRIMCSY